MVSTSITVACTLLCVGIAKGFEMQQQPNLHSFMQSSTPRISNVARIDGDVILGGLFSLHRQSLSDGECDTRTTTRNVVRVEAMLYAIDEINNNSQILPNITLGAEIRDDCYSGTIALEECLNFVLNAFGQVGKICSDAESQPPPIMGVVGTVSSQIATTVASLLRLFRLPQISYGATSPDLSNRDEYEYFARTVPSDEFQAEALIDVIVQLGWSAVFLISSSGNYGERIREGFVRRATNDSVCIVDELIIGAWAEQQAEIKVEEFLLRINESASAVRGVVLLTESFHARVVLRAVNSTGIGPNRFRWLATDTWGTGLPLRGVEKEMADGAITVALHAATPGSLRSFHDYLRALEPGTNPRNPWFDSLWEREECEISQNRTKSAGRSWCNHTDVIPFDDDKVPYVFDSVYAFAHALHAMLNATNGSFDLRARLDELSQDGKNVLSDVLKTNFTGKSGRVTFDAEGNGTPRYDIMSYVDEKYSEITVWDEGVFTDVSWFERRKEMPDFASYCGQKCKIGEERFRGQPSCCWECRECSKNQFVDAEYQCKSCAAGEQRNRERTGCERLPEKGPLLSVVVLLAIWGSLGLLCTAFVAFTMYRFYSTPLMMASGRELMLVLLAGIALSFCLGFAMLGSPSTRRCVYQRFGSGVFLAICYSAILVKTNRIARIFRGRHRPAFITPGPQLLITALLVSIQVGISLMASMFGTSTEVTAFYESNHVQMICRTSGLEYVISLSYNVLLLLLCTGYAFLTRKLPANFNEAKLVGITMYTTCVQWICFVPLFYGTTPGYQTSVLLLNSCFNATVLLIGMFGQKVYVVWFRPEKNTRQASNPRGRMGSSTSASAQSIHTDDVVNGNFLEKGFSASDIRRFSSKTTLESTVGVIFP